MKLVTATLHKRRTEDGTVELFESVPIGKTYQVDLDSIQEADFYNIDLGRAHTKRVITVYERGVLKGWFAVELLTLPES